jgi:hypothetical protein
LAGVIRGEDGNPLEGVSLYLDGRRYTTDQGGRYDAPDIPGGTYALTIRLPYELRRKTALRDEKRGETFGYPNTLFYPGELNRKLAAAVTLAPGVHMTNFDIDLRRGRLVQMKGKLVGAPANAQVELDSPNGLPEGAYGKQATICRTSPRSTSARPACGIWTWFSRRLRASRARYGHRARICTGRGWCA